MYKFLLIAVLIGLTISAPVEEDPKFELPCLNKPAGQRLKHPTDQHKYLRCVSADTLWVETCPDGLFYNPTDEICDWSVLPRSTSPSNEVVKNRAVLVKIKQNGQQTQVDEQPQELVQ